MTDFCKLCGHADIFHCMGSTWCFGIRVVFSDDGETEVRREPCRCPNMHYDYKYADEDFKKLKEKGISVG